MTKQDFIDAILNAPVIVSLISAVAAVWIAVTKNTSAQGYTDEKVKKLIVDLKEAKELIQKKHELNTKLLNHFENMKVVARIVYDQYEREFHEDPGKIQMLKDLKEVIDFDPTKMK